MSREAVRRGVLVASAILLVGALAVHGDPAPATVGRQAAPATASVVPWTGQGRAPCPEGQTRVKQVLSQNFAAIPQARFNRGFYTVSSTLGGTAARSLMPADGSRTRDHMFLNWTSVTPGQRTMLAFATRGTTPGGYYATADVNSQHIQVPVGSTSWSGRVYDVTAATDDEDGALGTWFEHRARTGTRTWWDLDNVQIYTCRTAPVSRIAGTNRYETSARVSSRYAVGVPMAFLVRGSEFADGVSASALAASLGAPVLLVTRDGIPAAVRTELGRLRPQRITIVGGENVVGEAVATQAVQYATTGDVRRLAGRNRYETSALVATQFPPGPDVAYLTSGADFPDALTGSALAGSRGLPLLLTGETSLPAPVREALQSLAPRSVVIIGGTGSVSSEVANQVRALLRVPVTRINGTNRYGTAAAVANEFPTDLPRVYVTAGHTFPDSLSGSALAGAEGVPVLLARPSTVPSATTTALERLSPAQGVLIGGRNVLHPIVMDLIGGQVG